MNGVLALLLVAFVGAQGPANAEGTWRADLPGSGALTLKLGRGGKADVFGVPGTWEQDGKAVSVGSADGPAAGELADGRLLLVVAGMPLVFVRVGEAPSARPAPTRAAPRWKAARLLPGRRVAPEGMFAQIRVPRGLRHDVQGGVLVVADQRGEGPGHIRVEGRLMTTTERELPLKLLLAQAIAAQTKGAPTETARPPEAVRVGRYEGARAELKVHQVSEAGAFTKLDLDVFVLRVDRFAYVFAGAWPEARRAKLRPALETMVSTFKFRRPTENKTLRRQVLGCWKRDLGPSSPGEGSGPELGASWRFDGPSGRYAYDERPAVPEAGTIGTAAPNEQGGFLVVGRELRIFPDDGGARSLTAKKQSGALMVDGTRWRPCE